MTTLKKSGTNFTKRSNETDLQNHTADDDTADNLEQSTKTVHCIVPAKQNRRELSKSQKSLNIVGKKQSKKFGF